MVQDVNVFSQNLANRGNHRGRFQIWLLPVTETNIRWLKYSIFPDICLLPRSTGSKRKSSKIRVNSGGGIAQSLFLIDCGSIWLGSKTPTFCSPETRVSQCGRRRAPKWAASLGLHQVGHAGHCEIHKNFWKRLFDDWHEYSFLRTMGNSPFAVRAEEGPQVRGIYGPPSSRVRWS